MILNKRESLLETLATPPHCNWSPSLNRHFLSVLEQQLGVHVALPNPHSPIFGVMFQQNQTRCSFLNSGHVANYLPHFHPGEFAAVFWPDNPAMQPETVNWFNSSLSVFPLNASPFHTNSEQLAPLRHTCYQAKLFRHPGSLSSLTEFFCLSGLPSQTPASLCPNFSWSSFLKDL